MNSSVVECEDGDRVIFQAIKEKNWQSQLLSVLPFHESPVLFQITNKQKVELIPEGSLCPAMLYCYSKATFLSLTQSLPNGPDLRLALYQATAQSVTSRSLADNQAQKLSVYHEIDPAQLDIYEVDKYTTTSEILEKIQPLAKKQGFQFKLAEEYENFVRFKCGYTFKECQVYLCYRLGPQETGCCFSGHLYHNHPLGTEEHYRDWLYKLKF